MKLQSDPTIVYGLVGGKGNPRARHPARRDRQGRRPTTPTRSKGCRRRRSPIPVGRRSTRSPTRPRPRISISWPMAPAGMSSRKPMTSISRMSASGARWSVPARPRRRSDRQGPRSLRRPNPTTGPRLRPRATARIPPSATAYSGLAAGSPALHGGFDAVEGTPQDPLLNKTWDLSSPKAVPDFGGPEPKAAAAAPKSVKSAAEPAAASSVSGAVSGRWADLVRRSGRIAVASTEVNPRPCAREREIHDRLRARGRHDWARINGPGEIKSVNGRGADVRVRVPPGFESLGEEARRRVLAVDLARTVPAQPHAHPAHCQPRPRARSMPVPCRLFSRRWLQLDAARRCRTGDPRRAPGDSRYRRGRGGSRPGAATRC